VFKAGLENIKRIYESLSPGDAKSDIEKERSPT